MEEIIYQIHWLAFTVHAPNEEAFSLYDLLFKQHFGDLEPLGHGGRGFRQILYSLLAFKIYMNPVLEGGDYFHFEIPGQACDVLPPDYFLALGEYLEGNFPARPGPEYHPLLGAWNLKSKRAGGTCPSRLLDQDSNLEPSG